MRHINLDKENSQIRRFLSSLPVDPDGSVLELAGKPLLRVFPIVEQEQAIDEAKLKEAILRRRDESRRLNNDWAAVDAEVWDRSADGK